MILTKVIWVGVVIVSILYEKFDIIMFHWISGRDHCIWCFATQH